MARQRRHAAIRLLANDPARRMLAADEPTFSVEAIAVRLVARRAKNLDRVRTGPETVQAVARNVAEDKNAVLLSPNGTFREAKSARALHEGFGGDDARKP